MLQEVDQKAFETFYPHAAKRQREAVSSSQRFVHYTNADTAMKIIVGKELWLRKSVLMNDYSEVEHGTRCLVGAFQKNRERFEKAFDGLFPGFSARLTRLFSGWLPVFKADTFIACISEHLLAEDIYGRLSMWRAYGGVNGVALVMNGGPFLRPSDALKAYTSCVAYLDIEQFNGEFCNLLSSVETNLAFVKSLGEDVALNYMFNAFRAAVLCTKHPGFSEEREWRIIHSPTYGRSIRIKQSVESIAGVPQLICRIPFRDVPEEGLTGLNFEEAIDRIIIGPTKYPTAIKDAFVHLLEVEGVSNAANRVVISDIPLRQ